MKTIITLRLALSFAAPLALVSPCLSAEPAQAVDRKGKTPAATSDKGVNTGVDILPTMPAPDFQDSTEVSTIAFGSCFNPREKHHGIFDGILKHQPDVFIFLGDNIYGDTNDMGLLKTKWDELNAVPGFTKLRESSRVICTWDDHDYGINDGGRSYKQREASKKIFLDFCRDPQDSPRRQREGVYGSWLFGPKGKTVQLLLLDTRYFRDELPRAKAKPKPGTLGWYEPTGDASLTLLGESQWKWLEEQLQIPADLRIIGSSIQILAHEKGMENWGNVPHEQKRLFDLLKKHKADRCFALSGDVHFAELSRKDIDGYPFHDFTSSGMSHTSKGWAHAVNSFRIGEATWQMNAGLIEINWDRMVVNLSAIGINGGKLISHQVEIGKLKFP